MDPEFEHWGALSSMAVQFINSTQKLWQKTKENFSGEKRLWLHPTEKQFSFTFAVGRNFPRGQDYVPDWERWKDPEDRTENNTPA